MSEENCEEKCCKATPCHLPDDFMVEGACEDHVNYKYIRNMKVEGIKLLETGVFENGIPMLAVARKVSFDFFYPQNPDLGKDVSDEEYNEVAAAVGKQLWNAICEARCET